MALPVRPRGSPSYVEARVRMPPAAPAAQSPLFGAGRGAGHDLCLLCTLGQWFKDRDLNFLEEGDKCCIFTGC